METLLSRDPSLSTLPYYDDLTPHGNELPKVWEDTKATIRLLAEEGIMINIKKSKFLQHRLELLGFVVFNATH